MVRARRYGGGSISIDVGNIDIDADEILDQLTDEELLEELSRRNHNVTLFDGASYWLHEARDRLMRGDSEGALVALDRALFPSFKTLQEVVKKYKTIIDQKRTNGEVRQ
jgi:hypothetical protein